MAVTSELGLTQSLNVAPKQSSHSMFFKALHANEPTTSIQTSTQQHKVLVRDYMHEQEVC